MSKVRYMNPSRSQIDILLNDLDRAEMKKRELQSKFIQSAKKVASETNYKDDNSMKNNQKETIKQKETNQEIEDLRKYTKSLKENIKMLEDKNKEQKKYTDKIKKLKYEQGLEVVELKKIIEKQKTEIASNTELVSALQNNIKDIQVKTDNLENENNTLKKTIKRYEEKQKSHAAQLKNKQNAIEKQQKKVNDLLERKDIGKSYFGDLIGSYKQKIGNLENKLEQLTLKNKELIEHYTSKIKNLGSQLSESRQRKQNDNNDVVKVKKEIIGTIKYKDGVAYFENTLGEKFELSSIKDGTPCSVIMRSPNRVEISKIFTLSHIITQKRPENERFDKHDKTKNITIKFKPYKVLIIGARNKDKYISHLTSAGLKISWYDSYEGNVVRLKNLLGKYDIIICCQDHARHYATNLMTLMKEKDKENQLKYNIIVQDDIESIIGRIKYVVENLKI